MHAPTEKPKTSRIRLTVGAGVMLALLGAAIAVVVAATGPHGSSETVGGGSPTVSATAARPVASDVPSGAVTPPGAAMPPDADADDDRPIIFVHILGEVARPGLYELHDGDRAIDAVAAAGGLAPSADQAQLNLARFLSDGEQIVVPTIGAVAVAPPVGGAAVVGGKVNVNTADAAALEGLSGVGPALAARIVEWRDANGTFSAVDDLLNVTGIGEKKLDGFRDAVTL